MGKIIGFEAQANLPQQEFMIEVKDFGAHVRITDLESLLYKINRTIKAPREEFKDYSRFELLVPEGAMLGTLYNVSVFDNLITFHLRDSYWIGSLRDLKAIRRRGIDWKVQLDRAIVKDDYFNVESPYKDYMLLLATVKAKAASLGFLHWEPGLWKPAKDYKAWTWKDWLYFFHRNNLTYLVRGLVTERDKGDVDLGILINRIME